MLDAVIRLLTIVSLVPMVQAASGEPVFSIDHIFESAQIVEMHGPVRTDTYRVGVVATSNHLFAADVSSGKVLYALNAHDVRPIASLTKLMTAMVVLDATRETMSENIQFIAEDVKDDLRSVFPAGETITQREALEAMLIGSVNGAGNALARETLGRENFIKAMNEKAKSLHLVSPTFVDPTGISIENRASAADVAALISIALSYPEIREITQKSRVQITGSSGSSYRVDSTNLLLGTYLNKQPYSISGAKTGSLPDAGYCMAQVTKNAEGHEVVVVTLGSIDHFSRYQDVKLLTSWIFDVYTWSR